ncbi:MAG: cyclic nucleotide-binding domain-containing protein [Lachnospiraceae bacterium]|nr:cyclic nucleotide-binding domain-containing protein [Lachnospiraceae bacterium]
MEKRFAKGEVIFKEGDQGESFYELTEGTVGIFKDYDGSEPKELTRLKKGAFLGEMAALQAYPRSATAVAMDDVTAYEISLKDISDYFREQPDRILDIMTHVGNRIRVLTDEYKDVSRTIAELDLERKEERSPSLSERIKRFAAVYLGGDNRYDQVSLETMQRIEKIDGTDSSDTASRVGNYGKGTVIFKEKETGDCMYEVHAGSVGIYKAYGTPDEKLLTTVMPNGFFGEMGMIDYEKRSATAVVTEENTTLETIRMEDLKGLFGENPSQIDMILGHLCSRLRNLTEDYMSACKLIYNVTEAESGGTEAGEELKKEVVSYTARIY